MNRPTPQHSKIRLWLAALLVLTALAYAGLFLSLSNAPFTDAPNHLTRAAIMRSLWFDPHSPFHGMFAASHLFMPYMLPDLGLMLVLMMLGPHLAYPVWSTLTALVLALAISFYARQLLAASWAVAAAMLCSWYFATNYLFILGFFAFQWGVAAAFVALGALEAWRRDRTITPVWITLYAIACFACYGAHPASFAILAAFVGAIGLVRVIRKEQRLVRFICELLPLAVLAAYHLLLVRTHPEDAGGVITHSSIASKLGRFVFSMFIRQSFAMDTALLLLLGAIIAGALALGMRRRFELGSRWELATVCGLAFVAYLLVPVGMGAGQFVDERLFPFFFIPLFILSLSIMESSKPSGNRIAVLMIACGLLAAGNLAALARFLPRQNREVTQYREALFTIPAGRTVLPIDTRRRTDGRTYPLRHAGSFYTLDRQGYTPYVASAQASNGPNPYFLDLLMIYRPYLFWYLDNETPDWEKLTQSYDYVVLAKPWRSERLDMSRLELHYENDVATVFRVRRSR